MKTTWKLLMMAFLLALRMPASAGQDKPITLNQLPAEAQQLIGKHFGKRKIALAKMEYDLLGKSYDVIFTNGDKVEFDGKGRWTELECKYSQVPRELVPASIYQYVRKHYPQTKILEISRDRKGYEVKLSNRMELEFDKKFRLIDIDD